MDSFYDNYRIIDNLLISVQNFLNDAQVRAMHTVAILTCQISNSNFLQRFWRSNNLLGILQSKQKKKTFGDFNFT